MQQKKLRKEFSVFDKLRQKRVIELLNSEIIFYEFA